MTATRYFSEELPLARHALSTLWLAGLILLSGCRTAPSPRPGSAVSPPPPELTQRVYLFEVVRHLYRWHLDESEIERVVRARDFVFWVRRLEPRLDAGDHSQVGEILLPQLDVRVKVKKADYRIEELGVTVQSQAFKITQVARGQLPGVPDRSWGVVKVPMEEMRDYLFRTRSQRDYPDAALVERMRQAVRNQAVREGLLKTNTPPTEQVIHLAPLSPVANETWVFWEAGHKLLYFASDIDLANPAVWQHESLLARIFDLDEQVVVSHEEAPGSNRFLTRYQVSRALFNCVVLGQRITLAPAPPTSTRSP
jgi:hypothetical protein